MVRCSLKCMRRREAWCVLHHMAASNGLLGLGHVASQAGHMVLKNDSQVNVTHNQFWHSACGIKLYGRSYARVRHNDFEGHTDAHISLTDEAEVRASCNTIMAGLGCGVKATRCSHCVLSHNKIMSNQGMGVDASDRVLLEMRANRVSANGQYGIRVDGGRCRLKGNVVFGNQLEGLHLENSFNAVVQGLSSSSSPPARPSAPHNGFSS